jgi:hypothetical protein
VARAPTGDFDVPALYAALDAHRVARGLSWRQVADDIWAQSAVLNARRHDHPISPSTITGMAARANTSCQHALFMLRWLGRSPESFVPGARVSAPLPEAGADRRLRWDLKALYAALDSRRRELGLSWPQLAGELGCTANQLTGLRTARFATGMRLAMRVVAWLDRPAADFITVARW